MIYYNIICIILLLSEILGSLKLLSGASTRETIEETETEEMLIGIVVRSVMSKESCALDGRW
jgi:hypothetical protein